MEASNPKKPNCMTCADPITEPAIEFTNRHGSTGMWQCRDCHMAEWGVYPPESILSLPTPVV